MKKIKEEWGFFKSKEDLEKEANEPLFGNRGAYHIVNSSVVLDEDPWKTHKGSPTLFPNHRRIFVVRATSSGFEGENFAKIAIDGKQIEFDKNENGHFRGLHICIINPSTAKAVFAKVFDTYKSSDALEDFLTNLGVIPPGYMIAVACKDDCSTALPQIAKSWLRKLGSSEISELKYRQSFAFIGTVGKAPETLEGNYEQRGLDLKETVFAMQVCFYNKDVAPYQNDDWSGGPVDETVPMTFCEMLKIPCENAGKGAEDYQLLGAREESCKKTVETLKEKLKGKDDPQIAEFKEFLDNYNPFSK